MSRIVYVNGRYLPYAQAGVHVEDRGFQLGDAIYEVMQVRSGRLVDERRHVDRLERSLGELRMGMPMSRVALGRVLRQTIARNRVRDGSVYLQVSRGAAARDFLFPGPDVQQTVVCIARSQSGAVVAARAAQGISVKTVADQRWARCDIKSVMLLPSCLAKEEARAAGGREAWLVDVAGYVTEGASSNAWIIDRNGRLVTRAADTHILRGVTRTTLLDALKIANLALDERPFTVEEARGAREAFVTSATNTVMPVVAIDGVTIGDGRPGPVTQRLRALFEDVAEVSAR